MDELELVRQQRDRLYDVLERMVGADNDEELRQMELAIRIVGAPQGDMAIMIDAIRALIELRNRI